MAKYLTKVVKIDDLKGYHELNAALGIIKHTGLFIHQNPSYPTRTNVPYHYQMNTGSLNEIDKYTIITEHELSNFIARFEVVILHDGMPNKTWTISVINKDTEYTSSDADLEVALLRAYIKYYFRTETVKVPQWMN